MPEFNYDQELTKAREVAVGLQGELEGKILGKTRPAWKCCCGAISFGEAEAVEIQPAGNQYEYQIIDPILWTVGMQETAERAKRYSCGLSEFLPRDEIQEMFDRHFAGINAERITSEYFARKRA
jgi:hypothetical protein